VFQQLSEQRLDEVPGEEGVAVDERAAGADQEQAPVAGRAHGGENGVRPVGDDGRRAPVTRAERRDHHVAPGHGLGERAVLGQLGDGDLEPVVLLDGQPGRVADDRRDVVSRRQGLLDDLGTDSARRTENSEFHDHAFLG
jgi:hypothetical protein